MDKKKISKAKKEYSDSFGKAPTEEKLRIGKGDDYTIDNSTSMESLRKEKKNKKKKKSSKKEALKRLKNKGPKKAVDNPEMKKSEWRD